jgi:hypothetical protein
MPSSRPWRRKLARAAEFGPAGLATVLHARLLLAATAAALRILGFDRTRRLVLRRPARRTPPPGTAEHVAVAVALAARLAFRPHTCLPRSLVLARLLARRGLPAKLRLGVRRQEPFLGHAWVEIEGRAVGEDAPHRHFTSFGALPEE